MVQSVILVCVEHLSAAVPRGHRTVGLGQAHVSEARELGLFVCCSPSESQPWVARVGVRGTRCPGCVTVVPQQSAGHSSFTLDPSSRGVGLTEI